ncbi:hypothetical protein AMAG_18661 [Allomyces macrogynus ATCC 38327]|uniref:Replication origin-binding protein domain-containing protein n=1 Tax=Allomyces macrogynus (strain ATCC 38327) TaxID=578462 RepID=A0A0L0SGZ5_ALLM3|nr:hypothetical protein AMAG_18661 [Allomyces macrogynus ATCC 38327]|eukprot:KNE61635.1 hypothetical protein AMAG_18661 [Allomyces macrogynus ATCC 38327]
MQICGYETETKHSYHITLSNCTVQFADIWKLKNFAEENTQDLGFDALVYSSNRLMKCINQSKPRADAGVYIEGSKELSKHLIQYDFDEECTDINTLTFPKPVKPKGAKSKTPDFVADIQVLNPKKRDLDFFFYDATPLEKLNNIPLDGNENRLSHSVIWRVMVWANKQGITFDDFMTWNSQKSKSDEPHSARVARYWGYWKDLETSPYNITTRFIEAIYAKFWPSALKSKALRKFRASTRVKATKTVPRQYLQGADIDGTKKFNVLATGMGSNKTGAVAEFIEAHPDSRVLWITPRITLAYNTQGRLVHFQHYKTVKDKTTLDTFQHLICSPCSLHYLNKPYDYIVIDESETVLQMYLTDKLHVTKRQNNFAGNLLAIKRMITESKLCIFMDAFITQLTMEFISAVYKPTKINEHLAGHVNVVRNTLPEDFQPRVMSKLTGRHVNGEAVTDETFFKMNILNDLSQGKKLYVFIPRKVDNKGIWSVQSFGEYLARQFDWTIGKQIKVYHGDRPQHELKELIDPDSVWASDEVRVVVANTKITVGVNFSLRNVFDKVYARYEDWVAPRDFFQAIYRIRHPKENEIVYMSTQGQKNGLTTRLKPIDIGEVREMHAAIIKNAQLEMDMNESASSASVFEVFRKMACINIRAGPDYFYELNPGLKAVEECGALTCLWKNIEEVEEEVLEHHFNTDDDEPSWETWLGIRKFMFKGHYGKYLGEDDMAAL